MTRPAEPFHISIHARPTGVLVERSVQVDGVVTRILDLPPRKLNTYLPVSFETAETRLARLPRLFIEPDGSFVWVSGRGEFPAWQLDGMMYDRDGRLLYVELKGNGPATPFRDLLTAIGNPDTSLVVQLVRHAVVMDADEFCRTRLLTS